jgi:hypothetical protein
MSSRESHNDFCTIDILETPSSEAHEMTFSQEVKIVINEFQRMINILVGIEKDLANELPRYVTDIDVCPGLEPPKKRRKIANA